MRASGRARLPTCVVKMRWVLRCMVDSLLTYQDSDVNRLPSRHTGYCVPPLAPPGAAHGYGVGRMTVVIMVGTGAMCTTSGPRPFVRPGAHPPLASATSGARWSGATGWCRSRKLQRVIQVVGRGQVGLLPVWA